MKKKLVVSTGAGISQESGIETFRGTDGLWNGYDINQVATHEALYRDPELVHGFYNERRKVAAKAQPNSAHYGLVELEKYFDVRVITQNIDDLHERAGSTNILHLHGELNKVRSMHNPQNVYTLTPENFETTPNTIGEDGYPVRPHIVFFNEPVPNMEPAIDLCEQADIFVIIGTSLLVYPAKNPIYYIDPFPNLEEVGKYRDRLFNITLIQKSATEGVAELIKILTKND